MWGDDVPPAGRCRRRTRRRDDWLVRLCVLLGAVVVGVFAAPAVARAADPLGAEQLLTEADAMAAQAEALVPQSTGAALSPMSTAAAPPAPSAPDAPAAAPDAPAAAIVADAESTVTEALASAPTTTAEVAPARAPLPAARPATGDRRAHRVTRVRSRSTSIVRAHTTVRVSTRIVDNGVVVEQAKTVLRAGAATRAHARSMRAAGARSAVPQPPRLPLPLPPQDLNSSGAAGGQGVSVPLLFGALAAVPFLVIFAFLSRALPRPAFRKPRRLVHLPWHPG